MSIYELTGEVKTIDDGRIVHRIRATVTQMDRGITAGQLGGWIQNERNLSGRGWVGEDAIACGNSLVTDNAQIRHRARTDDNAQVRDEAIIYDDAVLRDDAIAQDQSSIGGDAVVGGTAHLTVDTHLRGGTWPVPAGSIYLP